MKNKRYLKIVIILVLIVLALVSYRFYIAYIFYRQINCNIVSKPTYDMSKEEYYPPEDWYDHGDSWDMDWSPTPEIQQDEYANIDDYIKYFKFDDNCSSEIKISGKDIKKLGIKLQQTFSEVQCELDENGMPKYDYNNEKDLQINDNDFYTISVLQLIPQYNELGSEKEKILLENIEKIIPNNIYDLNNKFNPILKEIMSKKASKELPSLEKRIMLPKIDSKYERESFFRHRYCYLLSKAFIKNKEYENALLIGHVIFYLNKYDETNFFDTGSIFSRMGFIVKNLRACDVILSWANKPKPNCIELSKSVALDILDFVEKDGKLASTLEFDSKKFTDDLEILSKKGYYTLDWYMKSEDYTKIQNITYKIPQKSIDKSITEATKELEKVEKDYSDYLENCFKQTNPFNLNNSDFQYIISYFINPYKSLNVRFFYIRNFARDIKDLKKYNELLLAKMELTAIALVINAYVCENNKYPESIDELSKWFGKKLPDNRFTNEPYKLDINNKHLLYNNGMDGKADFYSTNSDDLYFDFDFGK